MHDLSGAAWRKSTHSGGNGGNCVEVTDNLVSVVAVRDSKDPSGPALTFESGVFAAFIESIKSDHG